MLPMERALLGDLSRLLLLREGILWRMIRILLLLHLLLSHNLDLLPGYLGRLLVLNVCTLVFDRSKVLLLCSKLLLRLRLVVMLLHIRLIHFLSVSSTDFLYIARENSQIILF